MLPLSQLSGGPSPAESPRYLGQPREQLPALLQEPGQRMPNRPAVGGRESCRQERWVLTCPPLPPGSLVLVFLLYGLLFKKGRTVMWHRGPVRVGDAGQRWAGEVGLLIIHFNKNERVQRELCACGMNSMRGGPGPLAFHCWEPVSTSPLRTQLAIQQGCPLASLGIFPGWDGGEGG